MNFGPGKHTRLVKEGLVLQSLLRVCVWVSGGWEGGRDAISEKVATSREVDSREAKDRAGLNQA